MVAIVECQHQTATRPSDYTFDYERDITLTSDQDRLRVDEKKLVYRVVIAISAPQEHHHHSHGGARQMFALRVISVTKRVILLAWLIIIV